MTRARARRGGRRGRQGQVDGDRRDRAQRGARQRPGWLRSRPISPSSSCSSQAMRRRTSSCRRSTGTAPRSAISSAPPSTSPDLSDDPPALAEAARVHLRERFLRAEVAISGANFAVAETGTVAVVESEGNGRMCTTLPRVLITVMGIEKVLPRFEDLEIFLQLLPRSATGERMNPYTSLWTGVRAGDGPDRLPSRAARQRADARALRPGRTTGARMHPLRGLPERVPGLQPHGRSRLPLGLPRADRRDPDAAARGDRAAVDAAVRLDALRRLLRCLPGAHRHPAGAAAPALPGGRVGGGGTRRPGRGRRDAGRRLGLRELAPAGGRRGRRAAARTAPAARRSARAGCRGRWRPGAGDGTCRRCRCDPSEHGGGAERPRRGARTRAPRTRRTCQPASSASTPSSSARTPLARALDRSAPRALRERLARLRGGRAALRGRRGGACRRRRAARRTAPGGWASPPICPRRYRPLGCRAGRGSRAGDARRRTDSRVSTQSSPRCSVAIAETGTICLTGAAGDGTSCADARARPARVRACRSALVLGSVPEGIARLADGARAGRPITLASGPSATSDIEMNRVAGVHGPRRLVVVLVG